MTSLPTNKTTSEVNTLISGIETEVLPLIESLIIGAAPDMGLPVVKQVTEDIEKVFANYLTKWAETQADFIVIDGQVDSEESALEKAQKDKASDADFQAAQTALVCDDGSSQP